jgi:hypothetical protein
LASGLSAFSQAFLQDSISSYEELEALLLLVRQQDRSWTAGELADALEVEPTDLTPALERLESTAGGREKRRATSAPVRSPKASSCRRSSKSSRATYSEQRLAIIQIMSANSLARVRSAAIRSLADGCDRILSAGCKLAVASIAVPLAPHARATHRGVP